MALRSAQVNELSDWSTGSLTSTRQTDGCSCGLFVLLVRDVLLDCMPDAMWTTVPQIVKSYSELFVNSDRYIA